MTEYPVATVAEALELLFQDAGLPPPDARLCADWLTDAEASGVTSHGVSRVPMYLDALRRGKIAAIPKIVVEQTRPGVLLVDGGNGMGVVAGTVALERAISAAAEAGIAIAAVRRSNHYGAAAYLLKRATAAGYIAFTASNGSPAMAVHGGADPIIGTNPMAAAFPAAEPENALAFDIATSVAAFGKMRQAQREGRPIPADWVIAPDGSPTTDPALGMKGALLPMSGAKGSALALMVEMLAGVLSGAAIGTAVGNPNHQSPAPADVGHIFVVIDPGAFLPPRQYESRTRQFGEMVRASRPAGNGPQVRLPGPGAHVRRAAASEAGLRLSDDVVALLDKELQRIGRSFRK
jgi:LDH2 family malate/lactate/ureidoglycolate dehydrogenase